MIAAVQRVLVMGVLALAAGWLAWATARGLTWPSGLIVLSMLLLPHALLLALEFVLLGCFGRDAATPRASAGQLLRAWWGEVWTALRVFGWWQPFRAGKEPDRAGRPGQTGVVLVHGFFCNRGIWTPLLRRLAADGHAFTALTLSPAFGSIDDGVPAIAEAVTTMRRQTGRAPVVVAHSMGGLAVRAWLASHQADDQLARVITIGSPHRGTWLARYAFSVNGRQVRQHSAWLASLASSEPPARFARFICFFGHADNIVFPASNATLPGADNRHLVGVAHVQMAFHPEVVRCLGAVLARAPPVVLPVLPG